MKSRKEGYMRQSCCKCIIKSSTLTIQNKCSGSGYREWKNVFFPPIGDFCLPRIFKFFANFCLTVPLVSYRKFSNEAIWFIGLKLLFLKNCFLCSTFWRFPNICTNTRSWGAPPGWIFRNMDLCVHRLCFLIAFRVKAVWDLLIKMFLRKWEVPTLKNSV